MKNVPVFQLFVFVSILVLSIQSYRDFMCRGDFQPAQKEIISERDDLLAQD